MYKIIFSAHTQKNLKKIPPQWQEKILKKIQQLKSEPFNGKKLQGPLQGLYSIRVWPYRILYVINEQEICIIIVSIGHRQAIYNKK